ncbi:hypothetical protein [Phytohabitans aurantiacus]|jgi:hypothetical protein|uniref:Lipoprotein n=1 Tax=Phytohabitans aurantiacus TaxID=3016789 RepID=A0ABQ5QMB6_9ACTN|nr:hypothetical protein [Phytohabitans aurantiacus]GLH95405.1 hypothetical protein Pa4123_06770 [Phytohabitans aurantiacus]
MASERWSPSTSERRWARLAAAATAALVAALTATACGGDPPAGLGAVDERNPLAVFLGESLGLIDYAQLKLRNECLAGAGYPQNLETMMDQPVPAFSMFVITPRTFGPTTEQEARRIGFGRDEQAEPSPVVSSDPNYDRAIDSCGGKAWDRLGDDVQDAYYAYFDLGNKISGTLMTTISERLDKSLPAKMLACVRAAGYDADDERQFLKTPRPALLGVPFGTVDPAPDTGWRPARKPGTIEVGPAIPARPYRPTAQESELAVAWLRCREQTTLADQQLTAAISVQKELVAKHETSFVELNPRIRRIAKQATELIGTS